MPLDKILHYIVENYEPKESSMCCYGHWHQRLTKNQAKMQNLQQN